MFGSRIYIAEGDKKLQKRLTDALADHGYDVQAFDSGFPIVEIMDDWPDLFLIDIELPDINGMEICKWLKTHEASSHIPVILISGESYLKQLASSVHPDDYIEKPVSLPDVIEKIRRFAPVERVV